MSYMNTYRHAGNTPLREWATGDELEAYKRGCEDCYGVSADRRFQAACAALRSRDGDGGYDPKWISAQAVRVADALLAELEKEPARDMTRGAKERCGRCEGSGWLSPDECMYGPLARCPECRPDDPTIVRLGQVWESGGQRITVVEVHDGGVRGVGFDPLGNRWYVGDEYPSWRLVTEPCAECDQEMLELNP